MSDELLPRRDEPFASYPSGSGYTGVADAEYLSEAREVPAAKTPVAQGGISPSLAGGYEGPLFADGELQSFRASWDQVQASFVDEPRQAVQQADALVASVVQRIADQFAQEKGLLEQQWASGSEVSTEELRRAFKSYRAFFGRLLAF